MIRSMTGYGHFEKSTREYKVTVEMKSVNHRYCDMSIKLPKRLNALESRIRGMLKDYVSRGKVDVYIHFDNYADSEVRVRYHEKIAEEYVNIILKAQENFGLDRILTAESLIRLPEVVSLEEEEQDVECLLPVIEEAVRGAGEQFLKARETEGANLQEDILAKLDYITRLVAYVEERSPKLIREYEAKIRSKVNELLGEYRLDEGVLATELVIYADKICVDEETVRLQSHINNMRDTLLRGDAVGRKLDFIAQEMNREANTILSKANDKELSQNAIDLKTEIEKIREQIQNIE